MKDCRKLKLSTRKRKLRHKNEDPAENSVYKKCRPNNTAQTVHCTKKQTLNLLVLTEPYIRCGNLATQLDSHSLDSHY
jgi:hypothetical protein